MVEQNYPLVSKRLKYFILFLSSIALVVGITLWRHFPVGYYSVLAISYGENDYPLISAELQGNPCILAVGIGARFPLSLHQETLDEIVDKKPQGTTTVQNIKGEKQEAPSYLIPKLKIGDLIVKNVVAHQSEADSYGTLGKFLGGEFNLLLDFPHSRIIVCDTFSKLQTKKVACSHWIRVPFEMHRGGGCFPRRYRFWNAQACYQHHLYAHAPAFLFYSCWQIFCLVFFCSGRTAI